MRSLLVKLSAVLLAVVASAPAGANSCACQAVMECQGKTVRSNGALESSDPCDPVKLAAQFVAQVCPRAPLELVRLTCDHTMPPVSGRAVRGPAVLEQAFQVTAEECAIPGGPQVTNVVQYRAAAAGQAENWANALFAPVCGSKPAVTVQGSEADRAPAILEPAIHAVKGSASGSGRPVHR